jgi:uncharacterized membrane protein
MVRGQLAAVIREEHEWSPDGWICSDDLARFRSKYVERMLADEKGELTDLHRDVVRSMHEHELLDHNVDDEEKLSLGDRLSDRLAEFGGSWTFIIIFLLVLAAWIAVNSIALWREPFDPYPYILLNLVLSCIAALQAPVIMMSQNRQEAKDRRRAIYDYRVNLKAELEIRNLHEKMDHLLLHQWQRLVEIQQLQMEIMDELVEKAKPNGEPKS